MYLQTFIFSFILLRKVDLSSRNMRSPGFANGVQVKVSLEIEPKLESECSLRSWRD